MSAPPHFVVRTAYQAAPVGKTAEAVRVNAVGYGATLGRALEVAAEQWLDGVFPVLHSVVAPHPAELDVERADFLAGNESGERFAWRVHLGPILVTRYGDGTNPPERERSAILQALLNELTAIATNRNPFWLELFACRLGDQSATTCLLRDAEWIDGDAALVRWIGEWPQSRRIFSTFASRSESRGGESSSATKFAAAYLESGSHSRSRK